MKIDMETLSLTVETIPWAECKRLLAENNGRNRPISGAHVDRLARDARNGRWPLTHQGIAFDPKGTILDGQHRLAAHAKAQKDLTTVVCRYKTMAAAENAMIIFDAGKARRVADSLAIGGVMATETAAATTAVTILVFSLIENVDLSKAGRFDAEQAYRMHRAAIDWSVSFLTGKRFTAAMRASFALAWIVNRAKATELAAQIREGSAAPGTAGALWIRAWTDGTLTSAGGFGQRREACLRALRIIKVHIAGEKVPQRLFASEETVRWFRARVTGIPEEETAPDPEPVGTWENRIMGVLQRGGAWPVGDIAKTLSGPRPVLTTLVGQMARMGKIKRVSRGVYAVLRAA
jgi:hypothetical protein